MQKYIDEYKEIKSEIIFAKFAIKKNIESSVELRGSFLFNLVGMAINNTAFLIIWMAFGSIAKGIGGWQPIDVLGMLGFGTIGYGIAFAFFGGIRDLPEIINAGTFDKYLLSPKSILLRLATGNFSASAVGDLVFGVVTLTIWFMFSHFTLAQLPIKIIFAIIFSICSALIYFFFSVFINSVAFYFADSRSIVQGGFEFLITPSIFYGGAFQGFLRFTFIFLIPALLLGTVPVETVQTGSLVRLFFVIFMTLFWSVLSIWVFNRSVRKYESSNFINFG